MAKIPFIREARQDQASVVDNGRRRHTFRVSSLDHLLDGPGCSGPQLEAGRNFGGDGGESLAGPKGFVPAVLLTAQSEADEWSTGLCHVAPGESTHPPASHQTAGGDQAAQTSGQEVFCPGTPKAEAEAPVNQKR